MKKLILLTTVLLFNTSLKAQVGTDLQFSQAFIWCNDFDIGNFTDTEPPPYYTVPTGKIWKIVSVTHMNNYCNLIIGNSVFTRIYAAGVNFPIIIPENKTVDIENYGTIPVCFSIIEYTVIP